MLSGALGGGGGGGLDFESNRKSSGELPITDLATGSNL